MTGMDEIATLRSISMQNAMRAALALQENLNYYEDADERMPVSAAAKIFELSADRIGFGKHTHNTNVNIDFAAQLDLAIDRSRSVRTIDARPSSPAQGSLPAQPRSGDGEGQECRGDAPALAPRRVPAEDRPSVRSVQGNDSPLPLTRRF